MLNFQYKGIAVRNSLRMKLPVLTNSTLLIVTEIVGFYFSFNKKHGNQCDWPCWSA